MFAIPEFTFDLITFTYALLIGGLGFQGNPYLLIGIFLMGLFPPFY